LIYWNIKILSGEASSRLMNIFRRFNAKNTGRRDFTASHGTFRNRDDMFDAETLILLSETKNADQ
jgi:hypothetical protein